MSAGRPPLLAPAARTALLDRYRGGDRVKALATEFNITSSYVSRLANRAGLRRQQHRKRDAVAAAPKE